GPPNGPHPRTRRLHSSPTRPAAQYRGSRPSPTTTRLASQHPTRQNLCDEVLGRSGRSEPARDLAPRIEKDTGSHEGAEVRARHGFRPDLTSRASDQSRGGKQLFGSNDLVVAGSEQEDGATYLREIDRPSERLETAGCELILPVEPLRDLKIEG